MYTTRRRTSVIKVVPPLSSLKDTLCIIISLLCFPSSQLFGSYRKIRFPAECNGKKGSVCVRSCTRRQDGDYQSCESCHKYITCTSGKIVHRPCAGSTVWDDNIKKCEWKSTTCRSCDDGNVGFHIPLYPWPTL